jgi:hypothetical protein
MDLHDRIQHSENFSMFDRRLLMTYISRAASISLVLTTVFLIAPLAADAQRGEGGGPRGGGEGEGGGGRPHPMPLPPPVLVTPTPPPTPKDPPVVQTTKPIFPPVLVQTDVQSTLSQFPGGAPAGGAVFHQKALDGAVLLKSMEFPSDDAAAGPISGITIKWLEGARFSKPNEFIVKLDDGEILVSVKKPSKLALIKTPLGNVSVAANGDVLARFEKGVLRVTNLDGTGKAIKAKFDRKGIFDKPIVLALAAGSELVAGERKLSRRELRPKDGLARRGFKVIENAHLAISEISIQSILMHNDLIADLRQATSGSRERRIVGDMSKMAAILNAKNGTQGFTVEDSSQVATKPTQATQ